MMNAPYHYFGGYRSVALQPRLKLVIQGRRFDMFRYHKPPAECVSNALLAMGIAGHGEKKTVNFASSEISSFTIPGFRTRLILVFNRNAKVSCSCSLGSLGVLYRSEDYDWSKTGFSAASSNTCSIVYRYYFFQHGLPLGLGVMRRLRNGLFLVVCLLL